MLRLVSKKPRAVAFGPILTGRMGPASTGPYQDTELLAAIVGGRLMVSAESADVPIGYA